MPTIKPGDVFYDNLGDGRYERCVLQTPPEDAVDKKVAARGGTGEFYVEITERTAEAIESADETIFDVTDIEANFGIPKLVLLRREKSQP